MLPYGAYWIRSFISNSHIDNEHYGIHTEGVHVRSTYRYDLGDYWQLSDTGAEVELSSPYGNFERTYSEEQGKVVVRTELRLPTQRVEPEDFKRFNRFIDLVHQEAAIRFWGRKK